MGADTTTARMGKGQPRKATMTTRQQILVAPALLCLKTPRLAGAVLAVLLAAVAWFSQTIRFDDNVARAFSSGSAISQAYEAFLDVPGGTSQFVTILAEAEDPADVAALGALRDLALEFELADETDFVLSPFSLRFPAGGPHAGEAVIPADPQPDRVRQRLAAYEALDFPVSAMITPDLRTAVLAVAVARTAETTGTDRNAETLAAVKAIMAGIAVPGYRLTLTGEAAISVEIARSLTRDMVILNGVGALLGIVAAWLIFRSAGAVICVVAPAVAGMFGALGVFAATGLPVTVISNVVLILVMVLGLADGSHLTAHFLAGDRQLPLKDRIRASVEMVGPACALTALTTAIALGAIAFADSEPLREFGIVGGLSTLVSYCIVIAGFVLCGLALDPQGPSKGRTVRPLPDAITARVLAHARPVVFAGMAIGAVATAGFATTQPWFSVYENIPDHSQVRRASEVAEEKFGGFFRFWAEFDADDGMRPDTPEGWARLKAVTDAVAAAQPDATVISATTLGALAGSPDAMPDASQRRLLTDMLAGAFLDPGADAVRILVLTSDPMRDEAALGRYDAMEAAARDAGATRIAGLAALARHEPLSLIRQLSIGLFAACLICATLVAAYFRNVALLWTLALPNVLPLAITAATLHAIAAGHMSPSALLALTVAFGVAVDDSIHYINRYMHERAKGLDVGPALKMASARTGQVMIITTLVICAGLLATLFSDFQMVRQFGLMLILTFASALAADLILLPALIRSTDAR